MPDPGHADACLCRSLLLAPGGITRYETVFVPMSVLCCCATRAGGTTYYANISRLVDWVRMYELDGTILRRFGQAGLRIFRILNYRGALGEAASCDVGGTVPGPRRCGDRASLRAYRPAS